MFSISRSKLTAAVVGCLLLLGFWIIGASGAVAGDDCNLYGCKNDCEFTAEFRIDNCSFKDQGINPWFVLLPGYTSILESPQDADGRERSVVTVLQDTKRIHLDGRRIETRVVEERASEWDDEEEEWVTTEISRNYYAICEKTNAVFYFGEWSRDCEEGFDENDVCEGEEDNSGSWEAGVNGARPGLIMPGTPLSGARFFQEIAPAEEAADRSEIAETGLSDVTLPAGQWSGCIRTSDTNPFEGQCTNGDEKIFCPRVGLVQDEDLELVWYGFAHQGGHHGKKDDNHHNKWH